MKNHYLYILAFAAALAAGCMSLPSVGPDYAEASFEIPDSLLPDAGYPTTNLTAGCEYRPADSNADNRVVISKDRLARWWEGFGDPVLEDLVESAVSNNISFIIILNHFLPPLLNKYNIVICCNMNITYIPINHISIILVSPHNISILSTILMLLYSV